MRACWYLSPVAGTGQMQLTKQTVSVISGHKVVTSKRRIRTCHNWPKFHSFYRSPVLSCFFSFANFLLAINLNRPGNRLIKIFIAEYVELALLLPDMMQHATNMCGKQWEVQACSMAKSAYSATASPLSLLLFSLPCPQLWLSSTRFAGRRNTHKSFT